MKQQNSVFSNFNFETMRASQHPEVSFLTPRSVKKHFWKVVFVWNTRYPIFEILNFIIMIFQFYHVCFLLLYMVNTWEIQQNEASIRVWNIGMPVVPSKKLLGNRQYSVQSSEKTNNNFPTPKKSVYFSFQTISYFYHFCKYQKLS